MTRTVLILGPSGKIGRHSSAAFKRHGWRVTHFDRAADDMRRAAQGVDVIVNGLNPPNYRNWEAAIPAITAQVIDAARGSGASVLIPGNVYHFGDRPGRWSQDTPAHPVSRKGRIRLDMEQAYAASGVQTIILRAGNFIDPNRQGCPMSAIYLRALHRGQITLPGPAQTRQAMCYLPDWAEAAASLAAMRGRLGDFEDIPFPGHTLTADEIKTQLETILAKQLRYTHFPWGLMRLLSPVWPLAYEMLEMRYLWDTDHSLDGARLRRVLPDHVHTPLEDVLRSVVPPDLLPGPVASASARHQPG